MIKFLLQQILLIFIFSPLELISDDWHFERRSVENDACQIWDNPGKALIKEWHFKREKIISKKYSREIPVWTSPAISVVNQIPLAFAGACDQSIYALNLLEKKIQWFRITNGFILNAPTLAKVFDTHYVFYASSDRTVYACDAYSGRLIWTKELSPPLITSSEANISSPVFFKGRLYMTYFLYDKSLPRNMQKGELVILNATDGSLLSRFVVSNSPMGNPAVFESEGKTHIILSSRKGLIQCFIFDANPAELKWSYQMPNEVISSPCILKSDDDVRVYVGSKYGSLVAISAKDGRELWKYMTGNWITNSATVGLIGKRPLVFIGSDDYCLYALDAYNGKLVWKVPLGGEIFSSPAFGKINETYILVAAAMNNQVYLIDAETGKIINSYFTGNPIWDHLNKGENLWGSPSLLSAEEESALVFGSTSGEFFVFPIFKKSERLTRAKSGKDLWINLALSAILTVFVIVLILSKKNFYQFSRNMIF